METRTSLLRNPILVASWALTLALSAQTQPIQPSPPLPQLNVINPRSSQPSGAIEVETDTVFSIARPVGKDLVILRDGSRIAGDLLTEEFSFQTAMGRMAFSKSAIAGIDRGHESSDIEVIATNGNDRFSGMLLHDFVLFRPRRAEEPVRIRLGRIALVLLRERDGDSNIATDLHGLALKNGDYFRGRIAASETPLFTSSEIEHAAREDVVSLFFPSAEDPRAKAFLKNGDLVMGKLVSEDLEVQLGIGETVTVPSERIEVVDFDRAGRAELMMLGRAAPVQISSSADQYEFLINHNNIAIMGITPDSEYWGALEAGDQIVALDGVPYRDVKLGSYRGQRGRFTPLRGEIVDRTRLQVFMTVKRNDELLLFRVMGR